MERKFGIRTIIIPVLAVSGFYLIQLITSAFYMAAYGFVGALRSGGGADFQAMMEEFEEAFFRHSNNIFAVSSVFVIIFALVFLGVLSKNEKGYLKREKTDISVWIASFFVILGTSGVISLQLAGMGALGEYISPIRNAMENYEQMAEVFIASDNIFMIILSTCILVPIAEELVFRGIVHGELRRGMNAVLAVIIQALIFSIIHINPVQIAYVFIPALVLGAVYEWTKSIYVPIFLHMVFNFTGAALPVILRDHESASVFIVFVLFAMIPVSVMALLFMFVRRKKIPRLSSSEGVIHSASGYSDNSYQLKPGFNEKPQVSENTDLSDFDTSYVSSEGDYAVNDIPEGEKNNYEEPELKNDKKWRHKDL